MEREQIVREFHRLYYACQMWTSTCWLVVNVEKCPLDLRIYQEIVFEKRPRRDNRVRHALRRLGAGQLL